MVFIKKTLRQKEKPNCDGDILIFIIITYFWL